MSCLLVAFATDRIPRRCCCRSRRSAGCPCWTARGTTGRDRSCRSRSPARPPVVFCSVPAPAGNPAPVMRWPSAPNSEFQSTGTDAALSSRLPSSSKATVPTWNANAAPMAPTITANVAATAAEREPAPTPNRGGSSDTTSLLPAVPALPVGRRVRARPTPGRVAHGARRRRPEVGGGVPAQPCGDPRRPSRRRCPQIASAASRAAPDPNPPVLGADREP